MQILLLPLSSHTHLAKPSTCAPSRHSEPAGINPGGRGGGGGGGGGGTGEASPNQPSLPIQWCGHPKFHLNGIAMNLIVSPFPAG